MDNFINNNIDIQNLKKLFDKRVIKKDIGCWDWKGSKSDGYCSIKYNYKSYKAHRVSWMIHYGEIPKGMMVCHYCDLRHCCAPEHLFLGTALDNAKDRDKKGNLVVNRGEDNGNSKITEKQAKEIRYLLDRNVSLDRIHKYLSISKNIIFDIKRGKTWKHVKI